MQTDSILRGWRKGLTWLLRTDLMIDIVAASIALDEHLSPDEAGSTDT